MGMGASMIIRNRKGLMGEVLVDFWLFILFVIIVVLFVIFTNAARENIGAQLTARAELLKIESSFTLFLRMPVNPGSLPSRVLDVVSLADYSREDISDYSVDEIPYFPLLKSAAQDYLGNINWDEYNKAICKIELSVTAGEEYLLGNKVRPGGVNCDSVFSYLKITAPKRVGQEGDYVISQKVYSIGADEWAAMSNVAGLGQSGNLGGG